MKKRNVAILLTGAMLLSTAMCGMAEVANAEEVVIEYITYWVGEGKTSGYLEDVVGEFNEKYKGEYRLEIVSALEAEYDNTLTVLAQADDLPVLIHIPRLDWIQNILIANNLYYPMNEFYEEHPEIAARAIDGALEGITQENGDMVGTAQPLASTGGLFYNTKLYQPEKAIRDMTVDEFVESLGDNKMALNSGENAWTAMLFYSALIANEEGGAEVLQKYQAGAERLVDFNQPCFINAAAKLKEIFETKAVSNAVGSLYAEVVNEFMAEKAAVIYNGNWMDGDFDAEKAEQWPEGFDGATIACDYYPGNVGLLSSEPYYGHFIVTNNGTEEEIEGALKFIELVMEPENIGKLALDLGFNAPNTELPDSYYEALSEKPLSAMRAENTNPDLVFVPALDLATYTTITETVFPDCLTRMVTGSLTPEEFCQELTDKALEQHEISQAE